MAIGKMKLNKIVFFCLFLLLIIFIIKYMFPKDYQKTYYINDIKVEEEYQKNTSLYFFKINYQNKDFLTLTKESYKRHQKLINNINVFEEENEICLTMDSNYVYLYPVCYQKDEQISFHLTSEKMQKNLEKYLFNDHQIINLNNDKINVYSTLNHTYYIYNYKGFSVIKDNNITDLKIFNKDIYHAPLITKVDNYLFVPDYEQDYYFDKAYIINMKNNKVTTWNLKEKIYFDSVILGVYKEKMYLIDKHENVEWTINPRKKELKKVSSKGMGITYQKEFVEKKIDDIIKDERPFYLVEDVTLSKEKNLTINIKNQPIIISQKSPSKIILSNDDIIYYLVGDKLYGYSNYYNEVELMSNFEWNFNYDNVIFVY